MHIYFRVISLGFLTFSCTLNAGVTNPETVGENGFNGVTKGEVA